MDYKKPLRRRLDNAMLGGVLSGIAAYINADVTLIRVIFVAVSIFSAGFPGILVYNLLWMIIPAEGEKQG